MKRTLKLLFLLCAISQGLYSNDLQGSESQNLSKKNTIEKSEKSNEESKKAMQKRKALRQEAFNSYYDKNGYIFMSEESENLISDMSEFFLLTLKENFPEANDDNELFHLFLDSCYNTYEHYYAKSGKEMSHLLQPMFELDVNERKIKKINKQLFKRDLRHYYYFYVENLCLMKDYKSDPFISNLSLKYPHVPFSYVHQAPKDYIEKEKNSNLAVVNFNLSNTGFVTDNNLRDNELISSAGTCNSIFYSTAKHILKSNDIQKMLSSVGNRQLITLIYWKLLCQNADVDFHQPLEKQEWCDEFTKIKGGTGIIKPSLE